MAETAYVYELVDKETGKWYVGSRTARNCHPLDLGVNYFTSSKLVEPLFRSNPERFEKKILVVSDCCYVVKVESSILKMRDAKNDPRSFNAWNGDGKFNASKAAQITVITKVGVHARSPESMIADARKGGLLGGKVARARGVGIFARTEETMRLAGVHVGNSNTPAQRKANGLKSGMKAKELGLGFCGMSYEQRKANGIKSSKNKVKCRQCGLTTQPGNIAQHQKATGHIGKDKITNVQA